MASGDKANSTSEDEEGALREDTMAQTGPGIPDDAASAGYDPELDTEIEREVEADLPSAEALFKRS